MASSTSGATSRGTGRCDCEIARQRPHQHERDERYAEQDHQSPGEPGEDHAPHPQGSLCDARKAIGYFFTQVVRTYERILAASGT